MQLGSLLPPILAGKVGQKKADEAVSALSAKKEFCPITDSYIEKPCIFEALRLAVDEYKDKILRGLNALTDEEIAEKRAEFYAKFHPGEDASPEELAAFAEAYRDFALMLKKLQKMQGNTEMLLTSAAEDNAEDKFARVPLPSNPVLQQQLNGVK